METPLNKDAYLRKLQYRAHHRGTREADAFVGGFFDNYHTSWSDSESAWFEQLLEEQDVDIMGWAMQTIPVPDIWQSDMMQILQRLDFISLPEGLK